jgi:hypothetical protein
MDDFLPAPFAPTGLVVSRWLQLVLFDLAAILGCGVLATEVHALAALGACIAFAICYVLWLRRRIPASPGRTLSAVVAAIGLVAALIGVGYGAPRIYLEMRGRAGIATIVDVQTQKLRGGGTSYQCTVQLRDGDVRKLQASSRTCKEHSRTFDGAVPVIFDPAHVIAPVAGGKKQLGIAKSVLPTAIGLLLILLAAANAIVRSRSGRPGGA